MKIIMEDIDISLTIKIENRVYKAVVRKCTMDVYGDVFMEIRHHDKSTILADLHQLKYMKTMLYS